MMVKIKQFSEDYVPLLSRIYPKSIALYLSIIAHANDNLTISESLSAINKKVNPGRSWNSTDKKARDVLKLVGLISNEDGEWKIVSNSLSAAERFELYWSHGMYDDMLDALEDDVLRRKAYKEALEEKLGRSSLRTEVISKMGLNPTKIMELLNELRETDKDRYLKIVNSFKDDESTIQGSISKLKIFKGSKPKAESIRIPRDADLREFVGINGYQIPEELIHLDGDINSFWHICDIKYCRERGHLNASGEPIPIDEWKVFQFIKLFLDEFNNKFGSDYPEEVDGILIKKELDAPASLRKGRSVWKKRGSRVSRLFKDIQTVLSTIKDNKKTKDYIKWWFTSGIVEKKSAEYTSGWLRSPLMMTAFMRHETGANGKAKSNVLSRDIVQEISSIDGLKERNHDRIPETIADMKILLEQIELFDSHDPRKKAVEICQREGII